MKSVIAAILLSSLVWAESIADAYAKSFTYEKMDKYEEAIKALVPLYRNYPNGYTLNLRLGWLFFLAKKYRNAIEYYQKASLILPASFEPRLGLCRVYLTTRSYEKAQTVAYGILKEDSFNYYANLYAASALLGQKRFEAAGTIAEQMLTRYPTDTAFLEILARSYSESNPQKAAEIYRNLLILDPNNVSARLFFNAQKRK